MTKFYMRIVAVSEDRLWVQKWSDRYYHVTQSILFSDDLMEMICEEFPEYWECVSEAHKVKPKWQSTADFLYNFGCTEEMRRKGESYIFVH